MRIFFINRYVPPDQSATSQILGDVAEHLAEQGHEIVLIGSRMAYDDPSQTFPPIETQGSLTLRRVPTTRLGRNSLLKRAIDYLSFYVTATWATLTQVRKGDIVFAKTDPPLLSVPIGLATAVKGGIRANWLQDLYPEVAAELGVGLAKGPVGKILTILRNRSLRNARTNVVIGSRMADRLSAAGVSKDAITLIPNWTDDKSVTPVPRADNSLRKAWGFSDDQLVIGYSGNLGRAHDLDTMLDAATTLKDNPNIRFLFIGGGKLRESLTQEIEARGLSNIVLKPYQPRDQLALSLSVADVHWASLIPSLEGLIVPSKIYGVGAAGRPLIFIGDPDGEAGRLLSEHEAGRVFEPGDVNALVTWILDLQSNPKARNAMGARARTMIEENYSQSQALSRWDKLIEKLKRD